jgi:hypothetical protein
MRPLGPEVQKRQVKTSAQALAFRFAVALLGRRLRGGLSARDLRLCWFPIVAGSEAATRHRDNSPYGVGVAPGGLKDVRNAMPCYQMALLRPDMMPWHMAHPPLDCSAQRREGKLFPNQALHPVTSKRNSRTMATAGPPITQARGLPPSCPDHVPSPRREAWGLSRRQSRRTWGCGIRWRHQDVEEGEG